MYEKPSKQSALREWEFNRPGSGHLSDILGHRGHKISVSDLEIDILGSKYIYIYENDDNDDNDDDYDDEKWVSSILTSRLFRPWRSAVFALIDCAVQFTTIWLWLSVVLFILREVPAHPYKYDDNTDNENKDDNDNLVFSILGNLILKT